MKSVAHGEISQARDVLSLLLGSAPQSSLHAANLLGNTLQHNAAPSSHSLSATIVSKYIEFFIVEGPGQEELALLGIAKSSMARGTDSAIERSYTIDRRSALEKTVKPEFRYASHKSAGWYREIKQ